MTQTVTLCHHSVIKPTEPQSNHRTVLQSVDSQPATQKPQTACTIEKEKLKLFILVEIVNEIYGN